MEELGIDILIRAKYSGAMYQTSRYVNIAIQASAVIFGGIILWRMSSILHKRKLEKRKRNPYFDTPYSKEWKNK